MRKKEDTVESLVSVSHEVTGHCVRRSLQGKGRLMDHDVSFGGGGPQGLPGWGTCDPTALTAAVGQQAQLVAQKKSRKSSGDVISSEFQKKVFCFSFKKVFNCYPVTHVLFSVCCQDQRPPLFGPLGCIYSKGMGAVPEHRDQHRHFIY